MTTTSESRVPKLRVEDLEVTFDVGRGRKLHAVDGVSFHVDEGETLGLVGESGSGKSTTGMAVLRLAEPTSGRVYLGDTEVTGLRSRQLRPLRKRMQIVFQDPYSSLDPSMTIGQQLDEPLKVHTSLSKAERRARVDEALDTVKLSRRYTSRYPNEFSGGQRQRIAIARAMILDPELVVCDEPVSALDVSTQSQIVNLLLGIQEQSRTSFLFIAHDLAVVRLVSARTAVMYLGQLVETGPSARVYDAPAHPYTAALNSAIPIPDPDRQRTRDRIVLGGDQPSPLTPPSGCRFRTRCPFAMEVCAEEAPPQYPIDGGGYAACHLHTHGPQLRGASVLPLIHGDHLTTPLVSR
ncbi:ABC transporter ATP-binding protein [Blastococcus mobilis]|uniref:Peptide/nickel transport system ATP-binding protein/oligopeptide transport system ATP-binding protein n=1 Tax=Blastococcus mobilis TaxID=1938746 RepID=A0A238Y2H8_9ACTN|nr:oligopeptide/dipeptide ABC transporter ATP-binding protein [Blastococcus mobilis]SNR65210.1 peptide/nickel transport system ATP-binding protein/oligopeptide transport system ATP-binding protein [Blastococcus mobilis]